MHARDVQRILRDRLILVHGNPFDFNYQWDLDSFARLYDVDHETTMQGKSRNPSMEPVSAKIKFSFNP